MAYRSITALYSLIPLLFALLLPVSACAQSSNQQPKIIFWNMQRQSIDMLIHHVPQRDADRLSQLKQTFSDLQCKGDNLYERPAGDGTNLICKLPGTTPSAAHETILLTANYENEGSCCRPPPSYLHLRRGKRPGRNDDPLPLHALSVHILAACGCRIRRAWPRTTRLLHPSHRLGTNVH
jgi:hypothetical protein